MTTGTSPEPHTAGLSQDGLPPRPSERAGGAAQLREHEVLRIGDVEPARSAVRLSLFGGFEVECDGVSVPLVLSAQRLVAFLALQSRRLPRLYVASVLWTDVCESRASGNLRTVLWRLREAGLDVVQTCNEHLKLAPVVAVDVHEAEAWARCILDPRCDCHDLPVTDVPFRRELLPGWYDDWILIERERHRQLGLHALEALADRLTAAGRHEAAVLVGLAAVNAEPLRESAHRALIRAHIAEGNPTEAVRQYRVYADLLRRELDLGPSEALDALMRGLRTE